MTLKADSYDPPEALRRLKAMLVDRIGGGRSR